MVRALPAFLLLLIAPAAFAFPGGQTFSGKVKCTRLYNDGSSGTAATDIITLEFTPTITEETEQQGTVAFSHTVGSTAGMQLNDNAVSAYTAFFNAEEGSIGLIGIRDPNGSEDDVSSALAEYKAKQADAPVGSLRLVYLSNSEQSAQRCEGTLKPVVIN
jgi:hypothetical protein